MEYLKDLLNVYKKAGQDTINLIAKNPIIIFLPLIYSFAFGMIQTFSIILGFGFSRLWGTILGLIQAMLISGYFSQMSDGVNYNRLSLKLNSFTDGFFTYLWSIYFMKFVFYLASLLLGNILVGGYLYLIVFVLLNAAGESIYIRNVQREDTFLYPINYLKENWYIWIPHVILYLALTTRSFVSPYLNPLDMYISGHGLYINQHTIMLIILGVYFTFRGVLFKNTYNSTIRKRKYMGWN